MSDVTHKIQFPTRMADVCDDSSRYALDHVEAIPATFKRTTSRSPCASNRQARGAWVPSWNPKD